MYVIKNTRRVTFFIAAFFLAMMFFCVSHQKKEFNRLAFLKKMEHPKHNVLCPCLSDKAFLKNQGPQALGIFISLSVSLLFFSLF